ncbi:MAG: Ger(x)C family spore germination protein [Bacilli bacterium]|nr:Ger(x)C family spore germination protein [Bacilli bacterium]
MKVKFFIILLLSLLISGCYDYREINDLAIVSAIGIDKNENEYKVIAQIVNTQKSQNKNSDFIIYSSDDKSIQTAYNKITNEASKKLYVNHLNIIVISEEVAKDGISNILDIISRDSDFRAEVPIIISKTTSEELLKTVTSLTTLNSNSIRDTIINNQKYIGETSEVKFLDFISNYLSRKKDNFLPTFFVNNPTEKSKNFEDLLNTETETKVEFFSNAVFKNDKLIGYLNDEENIGVNLIQNNAKTTLINIKCDDENYMSLKITNISSELSYKDKLKFNLEFKGQALLTELNCDIDLNKEKEIKKLEKKVNKYLKKIFNKTFNNINTNFNSDIFGFQDLIFKKNPKYYNKIKETFYENEINKIEIKINSNVKITSHGNLMKGLNKNE